MLTNFLCKPFFCCVPPWVEKTICAVPDICWFDVWQSWVVMFNVWYIMSRNLSQNTLNRLGINSNECTYNVHSNQNQCWKIIKTTIITFVFMMILMWCWYVWWKWCDMIIRLINRRWSRWTSFHHCGRDDAFGENNDATCRERHPAGKATSLTTPSFQDSRPSLALE